MKITQMKFQKIVVKTSFIFAVLSVFYALIFSSQLYEFNNLSGLYSSLSNIDSTIYYALERGSVLYSDVQPFNRTLFSLTLVYLIVSISLLVFFNQSRRLYYLSNYITTGVVSVLGIALSVFALINVITYMGTYTEIVAECNIPSINASFAEAGYKAVTIKSFPWSFIIGLIVFLGNVLFCGGMIGNAVWKFIAMKKEKQEYAEIDAEIYARWEAHEKELNEEAETYES